MTNPTNDPTGSPVSPASRSRWMLGVLGGIAALVLIVGLLVWSGTRDDAVTSPTTDSVSETSAASTTSVAPATTSAPTTEPTTTAVATTAPSSTTTMPAGTTTTEPAPTTTTPSGPSGDSWTVTSPYFPEHPFTLDRAAQDDDLSVYDGQIAVDPAVRCVAVVVDGEDGWHEWCGGAVRPASFIAVAGIDPWLIELGADSGDVTITAQSPAWTLPTNGCAAPVVTMLEAAAMGPAVMTGIVCVPGEAFVSHSSVLLQNGPPDGGGALLLDGDEGWNSTGGGTSIDCAGWADGVDRCELFGVEFELFEAVLPIPPAGLVATLDIVGVSDETAVVRGWTGAETDPVVVTQLISDQVVDPDDALEAPPTEYQVDVGGLTLVMIVVPQLDDSILSVTWAAWVDPAAPQPIVRATSWATCARGLAGPDLCI